MRVVISVRAAGMAMKTKQRERTDLHIRTHMTVVRVRDRSRHPSADLHERRQRTSRE
jgi:hypothetical protein